MENAVFCPLYPCFDTRTGAVFRRDSCGRVVFDCSSCRLPERKEISMVTDTIDTIGEAYFIKKRIIPRNSEPSVFSAEPILDCLKKEKGICKSMLVLDEKCKKEALELEKKDPLENIGIYSALDRDISIAFAHNSDFRKPPMPVVLLVKDRRIIGEMRDTGRHFYAKSSPCSCVLPPVDFPELRPFGKDIASGSPGLALDSWLRDRLDLDDKDATLVAGINLTR